MKRNMILAVAAVLLVLLGGGGMYMAYKGYKKYQTKKSQEFRFSGTMGQVRDGFDVKLFEKRILTDDILGQIIEKHDLVNVWEMSDAAAAKARIREKFTIELENQVVKVGFQDTSKEIARDVLQSLVRGYYQKMKEAHEKQTQDPVEAPSQ